MDQGSAKKKLKNGKLVLSGVVGKLTLIDMLSITAVTILAQDVWMKSRRLYQVEKLLAQVIAHQQF